MDPDAAPVSQTATRPRLLLLIEDLPSYQRHRRSLALATRDAGFEVHAACGAEDVALATHPDEDGIHRHTHAWGRSIGSPLTEWRTLLGLRRLLREVEPDLVHVFSPKLGVYAGAALRASSVPAAVFSITGLGHGFSTPGPKGRVLRAILTNGFRFAFAPAARRVIFQNPDDREDLLDLGLLDRAKTALIRGSGVDVDDFVPTPEPCGPPVAMLAGRLLWDKGVGVFVDAARRLRDEGIDGRFVLVGEGDPENPEAVSDTQLQAWHDEGVIEWWGAQDGKMPGVLAQSHVVCLPSTYREGIPKILLEGAACGRPLVATDTRGCREICLDGETGVHVPAKDPEALADALRALFHDSTRRAQLGARARELAVDEFSSNVVCARTVALYRSLLDADSELTGGNLVH